MRASAVEYLQAISARSIEPAGQRAISHPLERRQVERPILGEAAERDLLSVVLGASESFAELQARRCAG